MKRTDKKFLRLTTAAKIIGCDPKTVIRNGWLKTFKLNPDKTNSPLMVSRRELRAFVERVEMK